MFSMAVAAKSPYDNWPVSTFLQVLCPESHQVCCLSSNPVGQYAHYERIDVRD